MDRAFLARQSEAARAACAAGIGCDGSAFATDDLTIVDRPEPPAWPYTALALTFGAGTVLSLDPAYRAVAEANLPRRHWHVIYPPFLQHLVDEARKRGTNLAPRAPNLGFVLAEQPAAVDAPPGLELREVDAAWMNAQQASGRFSNGVGEGEPDGRTYRNQFGVALFDDHGEPVAIAGVFLTYGLYEIGVDVVRERRGDGLGRSVVSEAARLTVEREKTPVYFCSSTNVRSQRTALSSGFVPVCTETSLS